MRAAILYEPADAEKNREYIALFRKEFEQRGVDLSLLYTGDIGRTELPDLIINRARSISAAYFFEERGVRVSNRSEITRLGNDKYEAYLHMRDKGVLVMDTQDGPEGLPFPIIVKTADGHGGNEVFMAKDNEALSAIRERFKDRKLIYQEMCDTPGRDLRIYIVGNRVIAGMMRESATDFRSNYSLGGKASLHRLTGEEEVLCRQAMEGLDIDHAAIDLIYHKGRPVFNELEDAAGSRMLYANTDIDIVHEYVGYLMG